MSNSHPTPSFFPTPVRDVPHYFRLFKRTFLILLPAFLIISGVGVVLVIVLKPQNPELAARALIGIEKNDEMSAVKDMSAINQGREDLMMSRTFLRDVALTLSLQMSTAPFDRSSFFDSVKIDSTAPCGAYSLEFDKNGGGGFVVNFYDTTTRILPLLGIMPGSNYTQLGRGSLDKSPLVMLPGLTLAFASRFVKSPRSFVFRVVPMKFAVESVYKNLTIKRADPEKGVNDITVMLLGRDYQLTSAITNAIADAFVEKNLSFKKRRTRSLFVSLEKQLQIAQNDLNATESVLKNFRSDNPQVGMALQTEQTVNNLSQIQGAIQNVDATIHEAEKLRADFAQADSPEKSRIAGEMLQLLTSNGSPAAKVLQDDYDRLLNERQDLERTYGEGHPLLEENLKAHARNLIQIDEAVGNLIKNFNDAVAVRQESLRSLSGELQRLPTKELQLSEFQRRHQIAADVYSAVLNKYNEAKVSDAVEIADFYVMDYAVPPLPPPADLVRPLILSLFLGLLLPIGFIVLFDFFDKTVRSPRQLSRLTGNVMLESFPHFTNRNEGDDRDRHRHPLILTKCFPGYVPELFESLVAKMLLRITDSNERGIVISGYESDCGKSTISSNLALTIAGRAHSVLLIDADMRKGIMHQIFDLPNEWGLSTLLSGNAALDDTWVKGLKVADSAPSLSILPAGPEPANAGALLSSPQMKLLKFHALRNFDYVIVDSPPLAVVSDAAILQHYFSHFIFVVRSGRTPLADLLSKINEYTPLSDKIIGYVLNFASRESVGVYRRMSKYYSKSK